MKTKYILFVLAGVILSSCSVDDRIKELSASYEGRLVDMVTGENVPVEYSTASLLFGDLDYNPEQPVSYYIKPDGTFSNDRMIPGRYEVYARGAFVKVDTLHAYDMSGKESFELKVMPNISLKVTDISVSGGGRCSVSAEYTVNCASSSMEFSLVWGTVPFPGAVTASIDTGAEASSWQKKYTVSGTEGTANVSTPALAKGKTYYVRVGAKANGSDFWNYSDQYVVTREGVQK